MPDIDREGNIAPYYGEDEFHLKDRLAAANERIRQLKEALEAAKPFLCLRWPRVRLPAGVRRPGGWEWELFKRRAAAALEEKGDEG